MKTNKILISILIALFTFAIFFTTTTYGTVETTVTKYLGIKAAREPGVNGEYSAYKYNNAAIFSIFEYNDSSATGYNYDNTIYCLDATVGFVQEDGELEAEAKEYNFQCDMKQDKDSIPDGNLKLKSTEYYNNVLWILDHMYVPETETSATDRQFLLENAKIPSSTTLTDDDIEAVQQAAIWYYTNHDNSTYKTETGELPELYYGTTTNKLANINDINFEGMTDIDRYRQEDAETLYKYFITESEANKTQYEKQTNLPSPIEITGTKTVAIENEKLVVGPFTITKNSTLPYNLTLTVNNGATYRFLDSNKNTLTGKTINDLVGTTFYITLDDTNITNINVDFGGTYTNTTPTFWTRANSQLEQPVVMINKIPETIDMQFKITRKTFDLSLRKYITKINNETVENTRIPDITITNLVSGYSAQEDQTTAIYKHRKDAIEVKTGDIITYTISIYNEGETEGTATEIVDYLPEGLTYKEIDNNHTATVSEDGRTITILPNTITNIPAYDGTTLSKQDIEIICTVTGKATKEGEELTNIARITKDTRTQETDRDSSPNTYTAPSDSELRNYKGNSENQENLADSTYFYKGQEDDDDFEKVKIIPEIGEYNLELVKVDIQNQETKLQGAIFNVAVNGGEAQTLTTNENGQINLNNLELTTTGTQTITIEETTAPTGYNKLLTEALTIEATVEIVEGNYEVTSARITNTDAKESQIELVEATQGAINTIKITVLNEKITGSYNIKVVKEDTKGNKLAGATFKTELLDNSQNVVKTYENLVTGENGVVETGNIEITEQGTYRYKITEVEAPNKYIKKEVPTTIEVTTTINNGKYQVSYNKISGEEKAISQTENEITITMENKQLDLALRKSISEINGNPLTTSRLPQADVTNLVNGNSTTAVYNHTKTALTVNTEDYIEYTLRIYNEGSIGAYAGEIKDYLPEGIDYIEGVDTQGRYEITVSEDGRTLTITNTGKTVIPAYTEDATLTPSYDEIKIKCQVTANKGEQTQTLTNIAEITKYIDENQVERAEDRDSTPANFPESQKTNSYNGNYTEGKYVKGQEDDDDFEKVILPIDEKIFDLSLRKFISKINNNPVTTREPQINTTTLKNGENTAIYTHSKTPLEVVTNDTIIYCIRVYNEGQINGYAEEITDYLPVGLQIVANSEINSIYGWKMYDSEGNETTDETKAVKITTDYLSKAKGEENILTAFDGGNTLSYKDVQVECKVVAVQGETTQNLRNIAEISKDSNIYAGEDHDDRDSTPNNVITENYTTSQQDDDDYEDLIIPIDERIFDLSLRKFITKINNNPVTTTREPQVDTTPLKNGETTARYIHPKTPIQVETNDTVIYCIRVYNEGQIKGYAEEITDYLPAGLQIIANSEINSIYGWKMYDSEGNETTDETKTVKITTDYLSKAKGEENILTAFDGGNTLSYKDIEVECRVIAMQAKEQTKLKNIAEISKYSNIYAGEDHDDRDSTPNNVVIENYTNSQQDDDDYEDLYLISYTFDMALRKYIISLNGNEVVPSREPVVNTVPLINKENTATYTHSKEPVLVKNGDIVTYVLRIYNEGNADGYASKIQDNIPSGLKFVVDSEINQEYGWKMQDSQGNETIDPSEAIKIETDYLAQEIITAYKGGETLSYKEVKIEFEVIEPNSSKNIIINTAEIAEEKDKQGNLAEDRDSTPGNNNETEDDLDKEYIKLKEFDLSLQKFIIGVNDETVEGREPQISLDENQNIIYNHPDTPVRVCTNDIVIYKIRIYNKGQVSGYASKIKDDIPEGLEFAKDHETNKKYEWIMLDSQGNQTEDVSQAVEIETSYRAKENETTERTNLIKALENSMLSYVDVEVAFKVIKESTSEETIINTAEIKEDTDEKGKSVEDKDSTPDNDTEGEDDIDKEYINLKYYDLTLIKFITAVNSQEITTRIPKVSLNEEGKLEYKHDKTPVEVEQNNLLTYTIRVYNEGNADAYAQEIKDNIPEGLEFVTENETNKHYGWQMYDNEGNQTEDIEKAETISTNHLSQEIIKAYDKAKEISEQEPLNPDYKEVKVVFKVTEPNTSDRIITNTAEITKETDEKGKEVEDTDSVPNNNKEGEDDINEERIKVKYFDLSLIKYVSKVIIIENGKQTIKETEYNGRENPEPVVKVDLNKKNLKNVTVKFGYTIEVFNEGEIEGYATELTDYIPEGLKFDSKDNPDWEVSEDGKTIKTTKLENTLLKPEESTKVEVILTWINDEENMGVKTNTAEISKDKNESETPDIDSVPNNKQEREDDIDIAQVVLSIITGREVIYITLSLIILATIGAGIILIKRYVL